jgi:hypothetical protein
MGNIGWPGQALATSVFCLQDCPFRLTMSVASSVAMTIQGFVAIRGFVQRVPLRLIARVRNYRVGQTALLEKSALGMRHR